MNCRRSRAASGVAAAGEVSAGSNDVTARELVWRRYAGDDWAAFDALPLGVRRRMQEHAYDAWAVNALMLWRMFRRQTASSARAERRMLRYLDECETLERQAFADAHRRRHGDPLPHDGACVTVMRYGLWRARPGAARGSSGFAERGRGACPQAQGQ